MIHQTGSPPYMKHAPRLTLCIKQAHTPLCSMHASSLSLLTTVTGFYIHSAAGIKIKLALHSTACIKLGPCSQHQSSIHHNSTNLFYYFVCQSTLAAFIKLAHHSTACISLINHCCVAFRIDLYIHSTS